MKKIWNYFGIGCLVILMAVGCSNMHMVEPDMENASTDVSQVDTNQDAVDKEKPEAPSENVTDDDEQKGEEDKEVESPEASTDKEDKEDSDVDTEEDVDLQNEAELPASSDTDGVKALDDRFVDQFSSEDSYDVDIDMEALDKTSVSWSFKRNKDHTPVTGYYSVDLDLYGAYFINHKAAEEKVVYLTFDEGYENGFTPQILDTLAANDVKATFFLTKPFIDSNPDLVKRMVEEGHQAGNHSKTHGDFGSMSDDTIYEELTETANAFEDITGQQMDPFFRPPSGKYSERALYVIRKLGFRSIFWSMAIPNDWKVDEQPGKQYVYDHVMTNYHNGCIILLHAVSESDTQALDDIIKDLKAEGYRFGSLYELE